MTKADIIKQINSRTRIRKQSCITIVDALLDTIKDNMTKGHNIYFRGFGTFTIKRHHEKSVYNINRGSHTTIPAHCSPSFKPGKELLHSVK